MQQETFIIGNREFTAMRMNAFSANKLLMRIQKVIMPVMGSLLGTGRSLGDVDVNQAARVIAENLDESIMENIVLPMFAESRVFCVESKKFIKTGTDIDLCFTTENLFDLYDLIYSVGRFQFEPFFGQLISRFGGLIDGQKTGQ